MLTKEEQERVDEMRSEFGDRAADVLEASLHATRVFNETSGGEFTAESWTAGLTELFSRLPERSE